MNSLFAKASLALGVLLVILVITGLLAAFRLVIHAAVGAIFRRIPVHPTHIKYARWSVYLSISAYFAFCTYYAIYPDDDFYFSEFKTVTTRQAPPNAKVIAKHATYPDFHGDYCSFSRIRLPQESYAHLQSELSRDSRFDLNSQDFVSAGILQERPLPPIEVVNTYTRKGLRSDKHYSIQFLAEGNLVEVHLCET